MARGAGARQAALSAAAVESTPVSTFGKAFIATARSRRPAMRRTSVIARTRREFEDAFPALYLDIGLDGVVLCDRDGYTRQQLDRIRALTREAGLSRAPTRGGFEWRWTTPPAGHWRVDWDGVRGLRA